MIKNYRIKLCFGVKLLSFLACCGLSLYADSKGEEYFEKHVRPLLNKHCYDCHSGTKTKGGLSLETREGWQKGGDSGPAVIPGNPAESLLIKSVHYNDEDLQMPPKKKGGKLSSTAIAVLEKWVSMGAPDPRVSQDKLGGMTKDKVKTWWSFQKLPNPEKPFTSSKIDSYINQKLKANSLKPVSAADKRTLIRRATYDLTGLPPTPEEVNSFIADSSPDAFSKVIDRLLASPQYGVKWGRNWLDVVRYGDTAGENTDRPLPHAWRYRNWVIESFNKDMPFDEFIRLQLSGDIIRKGETGDRYKEGIIATGYLAIARRFGHDIDHSTHLMNEDLIDNLGKNFLGLTVACARCHDHKYDPITAEDYYSLYGIFESSRFSFPGCEAKGQPRDLVPLISQKEMDALIKPWQAKVAAFEKAKKERLESTGKIKTAFINSTAKSTTLLAAAKVGEGKSVTFTDAQSKPLNKIKVRKGEVLQLTIFPNGTHGADTTQIEWDISESGNSARKWSTSELVSGLTNGNPFKGKEGGLWCFYEWNNGPKYLVNKKESSAGNAAIKSWSLGDTPSVFVNQSNQQIKVWTTLAAETFFVHPGPTTPVCVAWVSPIDGEVDISGTVIDAHPTSSDGVSFELKHITVTEAGVLLENLGQTLKALEEPGPKPEIPLAYAVIDGKPKNSQLQKRGDPEKKGDEIPRKWLTVFGGQQLGTQNGSGRKELGEVISRHPITARVIVNRIWQWHFGEGLVRSSNDFGSRGELPSHPELLDWLTAVFVAEGYSIKKMHRLIMDTDLYRRSSEITREHLEKDPENRLLGRFSRRRLNAEEIRDSLLFMSGEIDLTPAKQHPFPPESSWNYTQHNPFNANYKTNRRSAYLMVQRQRRHPFLALFDGADPNSSTAKRDTTTVPTQALYFLNDEFFHEQAAFVAEKVLKFNGSQARLKETYRVLFQREMTTQEKESAELFLSKYPGDDKSKWQAYIRIQLAGNEFIYLD